MLNRVVVHGPTTAVDAVRRALPHVTVQGLQQEIVLHDSAAPVLLGADCVFLGQTQVQLTEAGSRLVGQAPLVILLLEGDAALDVPMDPHHVWASDPPCAHYNSAQQIRLAARAAMSAFQAQRFFKELAGPWMHDARGALGVAQLALKIMTPGADPSSPVQKLENAVTRLGWLIERLPTQYALSADLPELSPSTAIVFPTIHSYVEHLRRVQPRRTIDLHEGEWPKNQATGHLVAYASGFAELAFSLSPARSPLVISLLERQTIVVESDCPERRAPFHGDSTMTAEDLERHGPAVPYRLLEVARLARRTGAHLKLEFTARGFSARAALLPSASGQGQLT